MRTLLALLAVAPAIALSSHAQDATPVRVPTFTPLAPLDGAGPSAYIVRESADSNRIYAGTTAGLFVSHDRGNAWQKQGDHRPTYGVLTGLAASPNDPDVLLAADFEQGLLRSVDGGLTWTTPTPGPAAGYVRDLEFAPGCGSVYAAIGSELWRSFDEGEHFFEVLPDAGGSIADVAIDASDEDHVYILVDNVGVFESTDGGFTFTHRPLPPGASDAWKIDVDPQDGDRLVVAFTDIFLSEDAGATWTDISHSTGEIVDSLAIDAYDPNRFYAGVRGHGLATSSDAGATWTTSADPGLDRAGGNVSSIAPSRFHAGQVLLGTVGGFFRTSDSGASFTRRNDGIGAYATVMDLAASPTDPNHVVAVTGGSAFVSHDGGATWTESAGIAGLPGRDIVADAVVPDRFYTADYIDGLWRSDDGGHSFYEVPVPGGFWRLAAHPTVAGRVFGTGSGLMRSDDGGLTFTQVGTGGWSWAVGISAVDNDVMYYGRAYGALRYSHDGGATWLSPASSLPGGLREIVPDPVVRLRAYAAGDGIGIYRTDDGGATWNEIGAGGATNASALEFVTPTTLLANDIRDPRLEFTSNGGATLREIPFAPDATVWSFEATSNGVYAGTFGGGAWIWK